MTEIISRQEAIARGLVKYPSNSPCFRCGPVTERYVKGHNCVKCSCVTGRARYLANPAKSQEDRRLYYIAHAAEAGTRAAAWNAKNKVRRREIQKAWDDRNLERLRLLKAAWKKNNPDKVTALSMKRRAARLHRTPPWADHKMIDLAYAFARWLQQETGVPMHVDHDIPLQGKLVSGLHVFENLRVLPASLNHQKSNKFQVAA